MVSRKINTDAIDENLLIASIGKSKIGTTTASILDGASQASQGFFGKLRFGILQAKRDKDSSMRLYQP